MTLTKKIENLQSIINTKIIHLNYGGCIHFAYFLSNALKKININHKIVFTSSWEDLQVPQDCGHVGVFIPNIGVIDSEEILTMECFNYKYKLVKPVGSFNFNHVRHNFDWNKDYNRKQNRKMNEIIKEHIK